MTRARDLGIVVGTLEPGEHDAITDVPGVRVGHTTVIEGDDVRTGVTVAVWASNLRRCASGGSEPRRWSPRSGRICAILSPWVTIRQDP